MTLDELLRRRLVFTVGKGGVGRTTVTLALGLEAARCGKRALLVELEGSHGLQHAIEAQREASDPPPGLERVDHMVVDGRRALEEYLALIIPVRRLLRTVFSSNVYQYFVAAAPGLKELMTVGKIWYEADRKQRERATPGGGVAAPDIVLVDGPATGHSLQYLRMPSAAADAFGAGLVHREAERILGLLRDEAATAVVVVTTPEEMPVNETGEIYAGLGELGLPRSLLVVNGVRRAPCSAAELEALRVALPEWARGEDEAELPVGSGGAATERLADDLREAEALLLAVWRRAEEECSWAEIHRRNLERLAHLVPIPRVELPFLFSEEFGAAHVASLARALGTQLGSTAEAGRTRAAGRTRRR